jgi:hypothetical protein
MRKTLQDYLRYLRIESGDLVTPIYPTKSFIPGKSYPVEKIAEGEGNVIYLENQPVNRDKFEKIEWRENPWKPIQTCKIALSDPQRIKAKEIADKRTEENIKQGRSGRYGAEVGDVELDYVGVPGEYAASLALELPYSFEYRSPQPVDFGFNFQARTSTRVPSDLMLHPDDKDDHIFIKVMKRNEIVYELMGWITAGEGKKQGVWADRSREGRPAFFVSHEKLWPIEFLFQTLNKEDRLKYLLQREYPDEKI